MPRSPRQETSTRKKKYEHSPSDDERKSSKNAKNFKRSGKTMLIDFDQKIIKKNFSSEASHSDEEGDYHRRPSRYDLKSLYKEPSEARTPDRHFRLAVSKDGDDHSPYRISRQSKYVFGRDKEQCDIRLHHSSCSNVHAVLQYRLRVDPHGRHIYPYLIDLGSSSGTYLNRRRIDANRFYKLEINDVIQFGESSKEFILIDSESTNKYVEEKRRFLCIMRRNFHFRSNHDSKKSSKHQDNKAKSSDDDDDEEE